MHDVISDIREGFMDCIHLALALPATMLTAAFAVISAFVRRDPRLRPDRCSISETDPSPR